MYKPVLRAEWNQKDLNKLRHRLSVTRRKLQKVANLPIELVRVGQAYAQSIAPNMTGTLVKAVKFELPTKQKAILYVDVNTLQTNPSNNPLNKRFNYAQYMHEHDGNMGRGIRITSGDPQFMWSTRDFLMKEMKTKINIILGGNKK